MVSQSEEEFRRFQDKQANYRGCARIDLKFLSLAETHGEASHLDERNVARLVQVFELEGCLRSEIEHRAPVLISELDLQTSLQRSGFAPQSLIDQSQPMLDFPQGTYLRCLHGKHRIMAASQHLMPGDKWWSVDLYLDSEMEPDLGMAEHSLTRR